MKSNTVGVSVTTWKTKALHFGTNTTQFAAHSLHFESKCKHFGVSYTVFVTEAIVFGANSHAFRPDNCSTVRGLDLFVTVYFHLGAAIHASGMEAILCVIRRVALVTIWGVFRRQDISSNACTVLAMIIAFHYFIPTLTPA